MPPLEGDAELPSREVLLQQLVSMIAQPLTGTARTLNAILSAVPVQLQKIVDEGLIGGGAAPAAAAPNAGSGTTRVSTAGAVGAVAVLLALLVLGLARRRRRT